MAPRERVIIDVEAETRRYAQTLSKIPGITEDEAKKASKKFVKQIRDGQIRAVLEAEEGAEKAAKAWGDAGTLIASSLSADAIRDAATGFVGFVSEIAETRAEIGRLSAATGISTETIAGLDAAIRRVGGDADQATDALRDFGERMFDAARGGGEAEEAFELLGFTQKELNARLDDTDAVLREVLGKYSRMEAGANKNAVGQQLFSDASLQLGAAIDALPLDDAIFLAERYGTIVDDEATRASENWTASLADLSGEVKGTIVDLTDLVNLGGLIQGFTTGFVFLREAGTAAFSDLALAASRFGEILTMIADPGGDTAQIFRNMQQLGEQGADFFETTIKGATEETFKFVQATQGFADVPPVIDDIELALAALSIQTKKNAEEAKKAEQERQKELRKSTAEAKRAAAEQARADREAEQAAKKLRDAMRAQLTAVDELRSIQATANDDQLSDLGLIDIELQQQIDRIRELEAASGDSAGAQEAAQAAIARATRDRSAAAREAAQVELDTARAIDDALRAIHDVRLERAAELVDASTQVFSDLAAAATVFQSLQLAQLEELAAARAASLQEQLDERAELEQAIAQSGERIFQLEQTVAEAGLQEQLSSLDAQIAAQGAATEAQLAERTLLLQQLAELGAAANTVELQRLQQSLDARIAAEQSALAREQAAIDRAFEGRKKLEIAGASVSGAAAVVAALAPPPIGAGPVIGAFLAAGIAGTTAAQIATINAQQAPQFPTGFPGFTRAGDTLSVQVEPGESINTRRVTDQLGGPGAVDRMNQGGPVGSQAPPRPTDRDGLLRALGDLVGEEMGRGRGLTQAMRQRDGSALPPVGKRPVYAGRK